MNCTQSTTPFNLTLPFTGTLPENWTSLLPSSQVFGIDVAEAGGPTWPTYNSRDFSVVFKNMTSCDGDLQIRNCTLQPATVEFPVVVDGGSQTITLASGTSIFNDTIVSITKGLDAVSARTRFGGIYLALHEKFQSTASMSTGVVAEGTFTASGLPASQYAIIDDSNPYSNPATNCSAISYANPLYDVLQAARDLSFRTAIFAANRSTDMQEVTVAQDPGEAHYHSDYLFLGLAIVATLVPLGVVVVIYHGYWKIGRKMSLSPIETAKAFGATGMESRDSNATAQVLVEEIGSRQVKYGGVNADMLSLSDEGASVQNDGDPEDTPRLRLRFKSPEHVLAPLKGWRFAG